MNCLRLVAVAVLGLSLTGCSKFKDSLFPGTKDKTGTNPASICRATPGYTYGKQTLNTPVRPYDDDIDILTGETQDEDGIHMTVTICKQDIFCTNSVAFCGDEAAAGCVTMTDTASTVDGALVEFASSHVYLRLLPSKGYTIYRLRTDSSCHGG